MFAVWLLPNNDDTEYLGIIIRNLSQKYNSSNFLPHITVYGLMSLESSMLVDVVKGSIENLKPFVVKTTGIDHSNEIWKTIFINLELNNELNLINKKLSNEFKSHNEYHFVPHISLIYKKMPVLEKTKIIDNLKIKKEFTIDKIAIQKYSDDVNKWKIVKEFSF